MAHLGPSDGPSGHLPCGHVPSGHLERGLAFRVWECMDCAESWPGTKMARLKTKIVRELRNFEHFGLFFICFRKIWGFRDENGPFQNQNRTRVAQF